MIIVLEPNKYCFCTCMATVKQTGPIADTSSVNQKHTICNNFPLLEELIKAVSELW